MKISCARGVPEGLKMLAEREHRRYETEHGVACDYSPWSVVAECDGDVAGIMRGITCYAEIYIDDIVVLPEYRGRGIGRSLVEQLESHFRGQGFNNISLVTSAFQAPGFYEKCGFNLEFVRVNEKEPKLTKYFFVKFLGDDERVR